MSAAITVVTPAYRAERSLAGAVASVLAQNFADWQMIVVSDDGADYAALLAAAGLADPRVHVISSGGVGTGASNARNAALRTIETPYAAVLDADDRFEPDKLGRCIAALAHYPIVSTALAVTDADERLLRTVGAGADRPLAAGEHKWVSISMDSMIAWDRRRAPGLYDTSIRNMQDLDFLLRLYGQSGGTSFHIGAPLHRYVKQPASQSNGEGFTERMIAAKTEIRARLARGDYGVSAADAAGVDAFLAVSLEAERAYPAALAAQPGLLFEDHLEPRLRAASTSDA